MIREVKQLNEHTYIRVTSYTSNVSELSTYTYTPKFTLTNAELMGLTVTWTTSSAGQSSKSFLTVSAQVCMMSPLLLMAAIRGVIASHLDIVLTHTWVGSVCLCVCVCGTHVC